MSVILYNIFLLFFRAGVNLAALFNEKASKWVKGRKKIFEKIKAGINRDDKIIWMHCASLGEFEQGRPLLEKLKDQYPAYKILLTFFSPSGYEAQKNYKGTDYIFYLPMDGPRNAKKFLNITRPALVIFVKYELWYYYLKKIKYRNIPLILISALFRKDMNFFKWHGGLSRKMLSRFDHLFVQNESSFQLLKSIGLENITSVSGDTRFDRVIEIAEKNLSINHVNEFKAGMPLIVAGSTWPEDEELLQKALQRLIGKIKLLIAPHEISDKHINALLKLFPGAAVYSNLETSPGLVNAEVMIVDRIGLLSGLYQYATISYIGGGFKSMGVHNVLEAAVYFKPVVFGPYFNKYYEAVELVKSGGGLPVSDIHKNGQMLTEILKGLLANKEEYEYCRKAAGNYVLANKGATGKILAWIQEKRLLTN